MTVSADNPLRREILERVREDARRFGIATLRPNVIAQRFRERGDQTEIYNLVAGAIQKLKESKTGIDSSRSPAALEPARIFDCAPKKMRLTVAGCARLWRGAQDRRPDPWEGRHACLTCLVGAAHAGMKVSPMADLTEALRLVCPRCLNLAPRLINGRFCISCYNRHCEALRGTNARGTRPQLSNQLSTVQVAVSAGDLVTLHTEPDAKSGAEVMVYLCRNAETAMAFGWGISGPGDAANFEVAA